MGEDQSWGGDGNPLSDSQREDFSKAGERAKKILSAGRVATFNGWTLASCAGLSLLVSLFSITGFAVAFCLAIVAWNEFRGRTLLRRFDPEGLKLLAWNQIGLMALVIAYCLWSMYRAVTNPSQEMAQLEELAGLPGDFVSDLTMTAYGLGILLTLLFQGLNARYYFTRIKMLDDYVRDTPQWIIDLQRASLDTVG